MNELNPNTIIKNVVFSYERLEAECESLRQQVDFYREELENIELARKMVALSCVNKLESLGETFAADVVRKFFGIE